MESAVVFLLLVGGVFALCLFVVVCGYLNLEQERAANAEPQARPLTSQDFLGHSRFFATAAPAVAPQRSQALDDSLVDWVEQYLQQQERLATEFVESPTAEKLHQAPTRAPVPQETIFHCIEQYLRNEQRFAQEFISNPSVETLYGLHAVAA